MSTLDAATAARLLMDTAEAGGSAAVAVVVGGEGAGEALGRRVGRTHRPRGGRAERHGSLGTAALDEAVLTQLDAALDDPRAGDGLREVEGSEGRVELYVELRRPVQELVVVGAGHIAQPLCSMGAMLGFRVTILDDRPEFATRERFPEAERLVQADFDDPFRDVPVHERTHIILVTRGHKYDYACLVRALRLDPLPAYVGMIGSRRRVRATYVQLLEDGVERELLDRIHAPVGLDIGAETPEEIAVAVAAELVLVRRGGTGTPLKDVERIPARFFAQPSPEET